MQIFYLANFRQVTQCDKSVPSSILAPEATCGPTEKHLHSPATASKGSCDHTPVPLRLLRAALPRVPDDNYRKIPSIKSVIKLKQKKGGCKTTTGLLAKWHLMRRAMAATLLLALGTLLFLL